MSNTYFQFKQFRINQERAAMKVGTDGVLLGAWTNCHDSSLILDIGTGTGLVALMLAQRCAAKITAIEIDESAAQQASENIQESAWNNRIEVIQTDFLSFHPTSEKRFDLIVSNPPYFENSFKAKGSARTLARHTDSLAYSELIKGASTLLTENGYLSVIVPTDASEYFQQCGLTHGLFLSKKTSVVPSKGKKAKRVLLELCKNEGTTCCEDELTIENGERHEYTPEFISIVRDFYLKL